MREIITLVILAATAFRVTAEEAFLQLSLTPDVALQSRDTIINGVSLNIWGENEQSAFALGLVNGSTGDSAGLSWGIVNYAENYSGVQLGFVNYAGGEFIGAQFGGVNAAMAVTGLQCGFVNYAENLRGVQLGGVDVALNASGLQLGFINYAESLHGVQVGFINIVTENPFFDDFPDKLATVFPVVNWSF